MTYTELPPAGWYPDPAPANPGTQRYWNGQSWTNHTAPGQAPSAHFTPSGWSPQPARPTSGPGSLASLPLRLCARLIDGLLASVAMAVVVGGSLLIASPFVGEVFPPGWEDESYEGPVPGIFWLYLVGIVALGVCSLLVMAYEAIATAKYGRTLGKALVHIRPLRRDGSPLSMGRSWGRSAFIYLLGGQNGVGLIDTLWCLWDDEKQCLHDKAADTVVVND